MEGLIKESIMIMEELIKASWKSSGIMEELINHVSMEKLIKASRKS